MDNLLLAIGYGFLGMIMLFMGYKIFDWLIPYNIQQEIFENKNVAAAVFMGLVLVAMAIIILGGIHG
ncbi:MAG: DUF350 domain-containing protein [Anaerolineae bacterium]|nr:DUF350 domain-containing protein [Anaerolineae bacterium]